MPLNMLPDTWEKRPAACSAAVKVGAGVSRSRLPMLRTLGMTGSSTVSMDHTAALILCMAGSRGCLCEVSVGTGWVGRGAAEGVLPLRHAYCWFRLCGSLCSVAGAGWLGKLAGAVLLVVPW